MNTNISAHKMQPRAAVTGLHVTELARRTGVSPATIRYYSRAGLLHPGREPENGYRRFSSSDEHRVVFIRQAQALGLTLSDIQSVFEEVARGESPCDHVVALVEEHLAGIRRQIAELEEKQRYMRAALEQWQETQLGEPAENEFCPLIERLESTSSS